MDRTNIGFYFAHGIEVHAERLLNDLVHPRARDQYLPDYASREMADTCSGRQRGIPEMTLSPNPQHGMEIVRRPDIVQMTSVHTAFDIRIFAKISCSLAKAGHKVQIVVPHNQNEQHNSIDVLAVPLSANRRSRMIVTSWRVAKEAYRSGARICHFHDPELMPAAFVLKLIGRKTIYDVHEDYPETIATKTWLRPSLRIPLACAARVAEWFTAHTVDRIFAATPAIARRFPSHKTVLLQNFPIDGELAPVHGERYLDRPPIVAYVGGLTPERGAIEMARAIDLVERQFKAQLHVAGNLTPSSLEQEIKNVTRDDRIVPLGFCDRESVRKLLESARMGLVLFHPHPNHVNAQPNKLYEYMSAGLPVIASDFPLWREIVEGNGAGLLVDPMNPKAIAQAIEWILVHPDKAAEMGRRGREAVRIKYSWTEEEKKLPATYEELLGETRRRRLNKLD
jgi:glycosyltransferase involved in cell wall biosynthesis